MTASPSLRPGTWIADPDAPTHALKPNADGSINANVSGGGSSDFGDPFPATGVAIGFEDPSGDLGPALVDSGGRQIVTAKAQYETVAASQTAQVLGGSGASGDYLSGLLVVPASTSPGNVIILDNAISITVFAGGASSTSSLVPFFIPIGANSASGAWKVTTGANVSVVAVGNFT
jgi:hypothetical protein